MEDLSAVNRRKFPRVKVNFYGRIHERHAKLVLPMPYICTICDLSAEGARIVTDLNFDVGDSLTLSMASAKENESLDLFGTIKWKNPLGAKRTEYGVKLFEPTNEPSKELEKSVIKLLGTSKKSTEE